MRVLIRFLVALAVTAGLITTLDVVFAHATIHFLGIDTQQSDNYDFVSGVGPMIVTAIGYGGLVAGFWHHVNCHEAGCWRLGKHKVDGTPWCSLHHQNARAIAMASLNDVIVKLDELIAVSGRLTDALLAGMADHPVPQLPGTRP